jgi:hypothetical protein
MTAPSPAGPSPASPSPAVRALDLLASEWTKFRSVRSTYWSLLVAVITPVAACPWDTPASSARCYRPACCCAYARCSAWPSARSSGTPRAASPPPSR